MSTKSSKLLMMAGGQVGAAPSRLLSAYVVLSAGAKSRVFKVHGKEAALSIDELPAQTTFDIRRFQREIVDDLPEAGKGMTKPDADWVCGVVSAHLKKTEGVDV
jgi:hypothetical protein